MQVTTKEMTVPSVPPTTEIIFLPYALTAEDVLATLQVDERQRLSETEALLRREQNGANFIQAVRPRAAWRVLLNQLALKRSAEISNFRLLRTFPLSSTPFSTKQARSPPCSSRHSHCNSERQEDGVRPMP